MTVKYYKRQVKKDWRNKHAHWSDTQKFEAVTLYLMVGKWPLVSEATHIPIDTLKKWKQSDWWKEYEEEIRRAKHVETSTKLSKIREKASDVVMDRLEHGDFQYNPKTGKFSRKPVSAKVAGEIMAKTLDKELLLEKIDEKPLENEQSIMERLNSIADKLLQASSKKPRQSEVIDVELIQKDSRFLPKITQEEFVSRDPGSDPNAGRDPSGLGYCGPHSGPDGTSSSSLDSSGPDSGQGELRSLAPADPSE